MVTLAGHVLPAERLDAPVLDARSAGSSTSWVPVPPA
jgi:hypothetical protein